MSADTTPDPNSEPTPGPTADVAGSGAGVVVQRSRRSPFSPPATATDAPVPPGLTVSRTWASHRTGKKTGMTRNRVIAGDLPVWSPLPPGELRVDRSAGAR